MCVPSPRRFEGRAEQPDNVGVPHDADGAELADELTQHMVVAVLNVTTSGITDLQTTRRDAHRHVLMAGLDRAVARDFNFDTGGCFTDCFSAE